VRDEIRLNDPERVDNWFFRAKKEAENDIPFNDRVTGIVFMIISVLIMLYFVAHQLWDTGFFTSNLTTLEVFFLYGSLIFWIITCSLDGIFSKRFLSRLLDTFGGVIFVTISLVWLLIVFPFEFAYFANVLPNFLRFLAQWISNDIARVIMIVGIIVLVIAAIYCPIGYKFVNIERLKREQDI
jgi:hypothetical protein